MDASCFERVWDTFEDIWEDTFSGDDLFSKNLGFPIILVNSYSEFLLSVLILVILIIGVFLLLFISVNFYSFS